ncbi:hypothetical protein C5612_09420 [Pseudomonas frederiksbergensis]|uniref:Uncharacterized protein n=1 Tax=Pseudomonas frederiksbergensis TaxID=104087 RepID=A0A2S8HPA6_9PSED|nr:hypothetical protein C5612_09420 [Pseudomonas frederiksbergensis]
MGFSLSVQLNISLQGIDFAAGVETVCLQLPRRIQSRPTHAVDINQVIQTRPLLADFHRPLTPQRFTVR